MTARFLNRVLFIFLFSTGCVRHATSQNFGLPVPQSVKSSPDTSLRAVFQQQTRGAFNPIRDDARIQPIQNRLKRSPNDTGAHLELAAIYEGYRLYVEALEHYTNALELAGSPSQANRSVAEQSIFGIVRCDQALGRAWRAIPLLEQFLKELPSPAGWNALGIMYDASGTLSAAETAFREAVAQNPQSEQWHNNLGYNLLLQNKAESAEAEFRTALQLNPQSATAHNNLATLLARRGDLQGAFEEFQFAADAATAYNNLAVVLLESGKYEESREELVKALALRRSFGPALSNFKLVQEHIRQREELSKVGRLPQSKLRVASAEQDASPLKDPEGK